MIKDIVRKAVFNKLVTEVNDIDSTIPRANVPFNKSQDDPEKQNLEIKDKRCR